MSTVIQGRRRDQRKGMILVVLVVSILMIVVAVKGMELMNTLSELEAMETVLEERITEQINRADEIAEYEKYTQTRKFIEEIAKDKLGLVYGDEIIFRNSESK